MGDALDGSRPRSFPRLRRWRLVPWLVQPALQAIGLVLYFMVTMWQIWTDAHLARYFNQAETPMVPMNHGPYRYVRHPRYPPQLPAVAMALIFASAFGWLLVISLESAASARDCD
jgi:protein-S-isoprenylcysteine O-methyltransferase Ste14